MQSHQNRTWAWASEVVVYALMFAGLPLLLGVLLSLFIAAGALSEQLEAVVGINQTSSIYLIFGVFAICLRVVRIKFFPDFGKPISKEQMPEAWRSVWAMSTLLLLIVAGGEAIRWIFA